MNDFEKEWNNLSEDQKEKLRQLRNEMSKYAKEDPMFDDYEYDKHEKKEQERNWKEKLHENTSRLHIDPMEE